MNQTQTPVAEQQTSNHSAMQQLHPVASPQPDFSTAQAQSADVRQEASLNSTMREHPFEATKDGVRELEPLTNQQTSQEPTTQEQSLAENQQPVDDHIHQPTIPQPVLEGHVFARLHLFSTLPKNLRDDARQFQAYVEQDKSRLFEMNKRALIKTVYSVKGKELVDAIIKWLHVRYAAPAQTGAPGADVVQEGVQVPTGTMTAAAPTTNATSVAPSPAIVDVSSMELPPVTAEMLQCAKLVAEALVLSGFLTPHKDDDKEMQAVAPDYYVRDEELLVPVAKSVTELETTSVWDVVEGAIYTRHLKRKAGLLGQITDGKDVYVVINEYTKKLYLFASDLARESIGEITCGMSIVESENSHFDFGVRVEGLSPGETHEHLNAGTMDAQKELVNLLLSFGAQYRQHDGEKLIVGEGNGLVATFAAPDEIISHEELTNVAHKIAVNEVAAADMPRPASPSSDEESTPGSTSSLTRQNTLKNQGYVVDEQAVAPIAP